MPESTGIHTSFVLAYDAMDASRIAATTAGDSLARFDDPEIAEAHRSACLEEGRKSYHERRVFRIRVTRNNLSIDLWE